MASIVKVNTYLTDIRHRADYGPIREEFFGRKMPAHTLVAVAALAAPEFLIEIEAVAGPGGRRPAAGGAAIVRTGSPRRCFAGPRRPFRSAGSASSAFDVALPGRPACG